MKEQIIFALDLPTFREAESYIHLLSDHVGMFKIGLQLFISDGKKVINYIRSKRNVGIFLDLKLHDIPTTVNKAVRSACEYKPDFLTVHSSGGSEMLKAAAEGCSLTTSLLAVTLLTSMGKKDIKEIGLKRSSTLSVALMYAKLAKESNINGFVCSPLEVKRIRKLVGHDSILVTPGARLNSSNNDQARVTTPKKAIGDGSDYLVIGREIRNAPSPVDAVRNIIKSLS